MSEKAVGVLLGTLLDLLTLGRNVGLQLVGIPAVVWSGHLVLPVVLDKVYKILTVGCSGEGDIVIREPSFELSLVPLVVSC